MSGVLTLYGNGGGNGNIALLQNVGYPNPILSHFRGTDIWNTATDSNGRYASTGWVGRFLANQNPNFEVPALGSTERSWPLAIEFGNALSDIFLAANGGMGIAMNSAPSNADRKAMRGRIPPNATMTITQTLRRNTTNSNLFAMFKWNPRFIRRRSLPKPLLRIK